MANIITAGNSTNGGTAITTDTSGTLNIVTGSGSGTTAVTVDGSGNMVVTGTLSASGGVSGGIRSGTAVASTSGTSIDFTSLPTGIKRITVMFSGVSLNGSANLLIQIGSGSVTSSGYSSSSATAISGSTTSGVTSTAGFISAIGAAGNIISGHIVITNITSTTWVASHYHGYGSTAAASTGGGYSPSLSGALDRVRITTTTGTDTFDAGSINIFYE